MATTADLYVADLASEVMERGPILCHEPAGTGIGVTYDRRVVDLTEADVQLAAETNSQWIYFFMEA